MRKPVILLVNPWIADFVAYDLWAKPLGLLMIGQQLRRLGFDIRLLDLLDRGRFGGPQAGWRSDGRGKYFKTVIPKPALLRSIPRRYGLYGLPPEALGAALADYPRPDIIMVTSHMTYWYPGVRATVERLRQHFPGVPVVLGGIYATLCPEHARRVIAPDYLVQGYGENMAVRLAAQLTGWARSPEENPEADSNPDLPWDLYPRLHSVAILTSRGCPFHCTYCATRLLHPQFVQRSPADVAAEIRQICHGYGVNQIAFYDDALLANKTRHFVPIIRQILDWRLPVQFHTPNGLFAREIDDEIAELMMRAGFQGIRLSLESIAAHWQQASSAKVTPNQYAGAVTSLKKAGFKAAQIEVYLLMGLPGQTPDEVAESVRWVAETGVITRLAAFSPIPGTVEWHRAVEMGRIEPDSDPLLTDNTIFPCSDYVAYEWVKQLADRCNRQVRQNEQ